MPKIQWTSLPEAIRKHLLLRLKERKISEEDLYRLKVWRESEPDAPDGPWHKDFGSFKICGEGRYPKTFLLRGQPAAGEELKSAADVEAEPRSTRKWGACPARSGATFGRSSSRSSRPPADQPSEARTVASGPGVPFLANLI